MKKKRLSIIIVHWNTPHLLKNLLSLLKKKNNIQIIIVDNASKKNLNWLKKEFPHTNLIENKLNYGYASACNQAVLKGVGEWLLFLNPDVEINPNQIDEFIATAEKNNFAACCPYTASAYRKPLPSCFSLLFEFTPVRRFIGLDIFPNKSLFGGCLLVKSEVIKSLGGWDERFFLWFEDSDLTLRLLKNNYKIGWVNLPIKHTGGESFKKLDNQYKKDLFFNSMEIYARKHFNFFGQLIVRLIKRRFSKSRLLPAISDGISLTVPNLKKDILTSFLHNNKWLTTTTRLAPEINLIVVTSSIKLKEIWRWRKQYPGVRFILLKKNEGFAKTVNIGFRVSDGAWVGEVNDDVIMADNWLSPLLSCADNSTGSLNPVILDSSSYVESAGIKILAKGKAEPIVNYHIATDRSTMVKKTCYSVDATNAAAVVYAKKALNQVGLYDENFTTYLEDIDLSLRLIHAGYKNIVCSRSKVKHIGQSSSKNLGARKQYYDFRNWIYLILKNWGLKRLVLNFPSILIERLRNISGIIKAIWSNPTF